MTATVQSRIHARRKQLGLSKAALARKLGVSGQAVGFWESGARGLSLDTLSQIAAALQTTSTELLGIAQTVNLDPNVLAGSLSSLDSAESSLGQKLSNDKRAKVLAFVYAKGGAMSADDVVALCRMVL